MPRGKYPRTNKTEKTDKAEKTTRAKTIATLPHKEAGDIGLQFGILRENIKTLADARSSMNASDAVSRKAETELLHHISALRDLRHRVLGKTTEELDQEKNADSIAKKAFDNAVSGQALPASPFPVPTA